MKAFLWVGVLWFGGIVIAVAGTDAGSLVRRLEESRAKLPAFGGVYRESVRVPGSKGESPDDVVNGQRVRLSWGDHDTDWLYEYAFGPKGSFSHMIGDVSDPTFKTAEEKGLVIGRKYYLSVSDGRQGAISERKPGLVNPAGAGYEIMMGESVIDLLATNKPTLIDSHTLQLKDDSSTITLRLAGLKDQWAVDRVTRVYDNGTIETTTVKAWEPFQGAMVPGKVSFERSNGGAASQTIEYDLVKPLAKPEHLLVWQGWRENAIVKDNATQIVYKYTDGKLIPHPLFNKGGSTTVTVQRGIAMFGALLLAFWLIRTVKTRPRGPRMADPTYPWVAHSDPTQSPEAAQPSGGKANRIPDSP